MDPNDEIKSADIQLALYTASHNSIRSIDHLGEVVRSLGKGSTLETLRLHRTKCAALITKVIAPCFLEELINDIGTQSYCIIVDESTDVSNEKLMAYCIRYYSSSKTEMVTSFLGFQTVERATAEQLHENFQEFLKLAKLDIKQLLAIATDGASNLCGKHNSLFTRLRESNQKLILLKCVCHSLHLCAQKASEELPSSVEFLLRDTRAWFSHSSLRKMVYEKVYKLLNDDKQPPKLPQLSSTRWLAFHHAVRVNIDQWTELKKHFVEISQSCDKEANCYTARQLANMYQDNTNLLYLHFLNSILGEVNKVNLCFQSDNVDLVPAYDELRMLIYSVASRIFKPAYTNPRIVSSASVIATHEAKIKSIRHAVENAGKDIGDSLLPIDAVDLGCDFMASESENLGLSPATIIVVKKRCTSFLLRLCRELLDRLPENFNLMERLRYFTPAVCLSESVNLNDLPWALAPANIRRSDVESEWRKLRNYSLKELFPNKEDYFDSCVEFWSELSKIKTANKQLMFANLATFALVANSLPISNATVERIFSIMALVKCKVRNRMGLEMLNAILRVRVELFQRKLCCRKFVPPKRMFELFNSKNMYPEKNQNPKNDSTEYEEALDGKVEAEFENIMNLYETEDIFNDEC